MDDNSAAGRFGDTERYRTVFDSIEQAVLVLDAASLRVVDANPAASRLLGIEPDALLAWDVERLGSSDPSYTGADLIALLAAPPADSRPVEWQLRDAQGDILWVELGVHANASTSHGLIVLTARDISHRRAADAALRDSDTKHRLLADFAADWVFWVDPDGAFIYSSPSTRTITGYTPGEFTADPALLLAIIHPDDVHLYAEHRDHELLKGSSGLEFRIIAKDGSVRWVSHLCRPITGEDGAFLGSRGTNRDITEQKAAEARIHELNTTLESRVSERTAQLEEANEELAVMNEELISSNEELEETVRALDQATRAKSEFLGCMSHELRTPLNAIIGFSGIMLRGLAGPTNDEQARQLTMISTAGTHLLGLVNQILDLSRIEAGRFDATVSDFDAWKLVTLVVETMRPLAAEKGLALDLAAPEGPGLMRTDPMRLEQILLNLLGNAVKFTKNGSITVQARRVDDHFEFGITDTGRGIPRVEFERIFEEFATIRPGDGSLASGTGLGLAVSRRLARLLGGDIAVESEFGAGSTFTLRLPAVVSHDVVQECDDA